MKTAAKIVALMLAALMLSCCLAGCGKAEDRLAKIKAQGYIQLANEPYFAPYEFVDPSKEGDAQYVGMDIEIAKYIADKIGVELKIVPLDFTAVLAGVTEGKYDFAISAIAWSPTREEAMNLSNGYQFTDTGYGFLCRAADKDKYKSIDDLKDAVVITQSGSVQESIYNDQVAGKCKEFKLVANMTDGYLAVSENKADVCIVSKESAKLYAEANGGLVVPDFEFTVDEKINGVVVGCPKEGTDELMKVINECIAELLANGKIDEWWKEYSDYAAKLGVS